MNQILFILLVILFWEIFRIFILRKIFYVKYQTSTGEFMTIHKFSSRKQRKEYFQKFGFKIIRRLEWYGWWK